MAAVINVRRKDILEHPRVDKQMSKLVVPRVALFAKREKPQVFSWAAAALTKPMSSADALYARSCTRGSIEHRGGSTFEIQALPLPIAGFFALRRCALKLATGLRQRSRSYAARK